MDKMGSRERCCRSYVIYSVPRKVASGGGSSREKREIIVSGYYFFPEFFVNSSYFFNFRSSNIFTDFLTRNQYFILRLSDFHFQHFMESLIFRIFTVKVVTVFTIFTKLYSTRQNFANESSHKEANLLFSFFIARYLDTNNIAWVRARFLPIS